MSGLCAACANAAKARRNAEDARARRTKAMGTVLAAIRKAAESRHACPSNTDLAKLIGASTATASVLVHDLAREGAFEITMIGRHRHVVFADGAGAGERWQWEWVRDSVARAFCFEPHQIIGLGRKHLFVRARFAAAWVLKHRFPALSLSQIGQLLGGRDHSSIIYALERADYTRERDQVFREATDRLLTVPITRNAPAARVAPILVRPKPARKPKPVPFSPPVSSWCDQCQARVSAETAARCKSAWCSVRKDQAA